jgi:GNAT superfamily N-acetyltransferase
MTIAIRRTTDLETVLELDRQCLPHDQPMDPDTVEQSVWWLATCDEHGAVGYGGVYAGIEGQHWLVRAGVLPPFRGRGLQGRLLKARVSHWRHSAVPRLLTYVADWNRASSRAVIRAGLRPYRAEEGFVYYDLRKDRS